MDSMEMQPLEEDGVEPAVSPPSTRFARPSLVHLLGITTVVFAITTVIAALLYVTHGEPVAADKDEPPTVKNVILLVGDGYGPAQATYSRVVHARHSGNREALLPLDAWLTGTSRTRSTSSEVTDSAAGATAFSCGLKTDNHRVAVTPEGKPCYTVLEAARQQKGMRTALVATSRISHATPAAFASHHVDRDAENDIAQQELRTGVDILLGGGRRHWQPQSDPDSKRADDWDGIHEAITNGYHYANDTASLEAAMLRNPERLLGLFAPSHMDFDVDRTSTQPSLATMTKVALRLVDPKEKGFFMMVEGSRIDQAAHINDPIAMHSDTMAFQAAVSVVQQWAKGRDDTLIIATADHETGGLTLGRSEGLDRAVYKWDPTPLSKYTTSAFVLARVLAQQISDALAQDSTQTAASVIPRIVKEGAQLVFLSPADEQQLLEAWNHTSTAFESFTVAVGRAIAHSMHIDWTSRGHTGVDVNLYTWGRAAATLLPPRSHENTDIGRAIARALSLDLKRVP